MPATAGATEGQAPARAEGQHDGGTPAAGAADSLKSPHRGRDARRGARPLPDVQKARQKAGISRSRAKPGEGPKDRFPGAHTNLSWHVGDYLSDRLCSAF